MTHGYFRTITAVLFLQGPDWHDSHNLTRQQAYYLVAGSWGKKAYTEAVKLAKTVPFEPILLAVRRI